MYRIGYHTRTILDDFLNPSKWLERMDDEEEIKMITWEELTGNCLVILMRYQIGGPVPPSTGINIFMSSTGLVKNAGNKMGGVQDPRTID